MAGVAPTLADWAMGQTCDWCQEVCDLDVCDLNVLTCSNTGCPSADSDESNSVYHKECVEQYLKSTLERGNPKYVIQTPSREGMNAMVVPSDPLYHATNLVQPDFPIFLVNLVNLVNLGVGRIIITLGAPSPHASSSPRASLPSPRLGLHARSDFSHVPLVPGNARSGSDVLAGAGRSRRTLPRVAA